MPQVCCELPLLACLSCICWTSEHGTALIPQQGRPELEPRVVVAPFLQHADLPGSLAYHQRGGQLPIKPVNPSPEPPGLPLQQPSMQPQHHGHAQHAAAAAAAASLPPVLRYEAPGESRAAAAGSSVPGEQLPAAVARLSGGAAGGLEAARAGSGSAPRQAAAPKEEDDGSGTDTDEDGELIAKARQKALAERQRAATVIGKKRGPGTGACLPETASCCLRMHTFPLRRSVKA